MSYNTIILVHGSLNCPRRDWLRKVNPGDSIYGIDNNRKEIMRWSIDQEPNAKKELAKYKCTYAKTGNTIWADEYALEFCECDEDGEFIQGADFELAETEE